jgi:hypothetical protein
MQINSTSSSLTTPGQIAGWSSTLILQITNRGFVKVDLIQMKCNKMQFALIIDYRNPSSERLFLGSGWGVSDVRGPYLNANIGMICISPWALSSVMPSLITLEFEMSNRACVEAVSLRADGNFEMKTCFLQRNKSSKLLIEDIVWHRQRDFVICIVCPGTPILNASEVISLNGMTLTR